jgi:hypothetical protein
MTVAITFDRAWEYQETPRPSRMRLIPAGWSGQLDAEIAAAAIADGVATLRTAMTPDIARRVAFYRRVRDLVASGLKLEAAIDAAYAEEQEAAAKAAEVPAGETPAPAKPKARKASA